MHAQAIYTPPNSSLSSVTFVDHLGKEELETYLGSLYCITDDTARGSQTKAIVLEKLLKMLRGD